MTKETKNFNNPPGFSRWLMSRCLKYEHDHALEGDLFETYQYYLKKFGTRQAKFWYRKQALKNIFSYFQYVTKGRIGMIKNYFKTSWRMLLKQKMYSIITISGLAVGLGVFLFFFRFHDWAMTADSFHNNIDRIYNIVQVFKSGGDDNRHTAYLPAPLLPALKNDIPEIEDFTRFHDPDKAIVQYKQKRFFENQVLFVDRNFFSFFTFEILNGDFETLLSKPNGVVISESAAKKYFGHESPVGKVLTLNNQIDLTVTGIIKELDEMGSSSSLYGQFFIPFETARLLYGTMEDWHTNTVSGFVRIQKGANLQQIETKLDILRNKYYQSAEESPRRLYLYPTKGSKFKGIHIRKFSGYSSPVAYTIFLGLGLLFLLIVMFNYINLSTARYMERVREVGVRKVVGARKSNLLTQFLGESILMTLIALPFALGTYNLVSSAFCARIGVAFDLSLWSNGKIIVSFLMITIVTGFLSGIYPAVFLSSFRPIQILKHKTARGKSRGTLRKILVIFQFATSVILIVLALVWQRQSVFLYQADMGYSRDNVLITPLSDETKGNIHLMADRLARHPDILNVTASTRIPGGWNTREFVVPEGSGKEDAARIYTYGIDYQFFKTMEMDIIRGRSFSKEYQDDTTFVVNRMFADRMQWDDPVGKSLTLGERRGLIVGVVRDFHFDDTFFPMGPALFFIEPENLNYLIVKAKVGKLAAAAEFTKTVWTELSPNIPFESFSLDDYFSQKYFGETHLISEMTTSLGAIAIFFSCLGLLALASFTVQRKTKEIGIRKVLGASVSEIMAILSRDFLKLIAIANLIGLPITYIFTSSLLAFAFKSNTRVAIGPWVILFTVFLTVFVAAVAITTQTYRAARTNPVKTLRYE